jgi:signal transduction histidine kinase/DNA-binding NarL/FixJ family response regulator
MHEPILILIIDDDEVDRMSVRRSLRAADLVVEIEEAHDVAKAVSLLQRKRFDCAFLDYHLPDGTGLQVLQECRAAGDQTPVVVLTGQGDEQLAVELMKAGAADYLPKGSLSSDRLVQSLRHAMRLHELKTQAAEAERALRESERAQRFLAEASRVLTASMDVEVTLAAVAQLAVPILADYCFIDVLDADGRGRRVAAAPAGEARGDAAAEGAPRVSPPPLDPGHPLSRVLREGRPQIVMDLSGELARELLGEAAPAELIRRLVAASALIVPLVVRSRPFGSLSLFSLQPAQRYTEPDVALALELAARAAVAVDHARLYQETQQAVRARDQVLGIVSHDLRNPLNTISISAALLLEQAVPEALRERQIGVIERSVQQMDRLIHDLLDVARLEAGRLSVDLQPLEIEAILGEVLEMQQPLAVDKGLCLEAVGPGAAGCVLADRTRLVQVFSNLLGNAIKFTPSGGRITVGVEAAAGEVLFRVSDSGPGIAEKDLPHLFDAYWQGTRSGREGAGLGLAITRGIVQAHGGRIWVQSSPGAGTTFSFSLLTAGAGQRAARAGGPA